MGHTEDIRQWSDLDDAELVDIYRESGTEAAFETLVRRYQVRLFRLILGLIGDAPLAEELCQQAFVKAALRLEQLREPAAFYGWLLRIGRAATMDELRKRKRRESLPVDTTSEGVDPNHETKLAVRRVLEAMTPDDRDILLLADLERMTMREIAATLGINESAAKMRLKRARERFREEFGAQG